MIQRRVWKSNIKVTIGDFVYTSYLLLYKQVNRYLSYFIFYFSFFCIYIRLFNNGTFLSRN